MKKINAIAVGILATFLIQTLTVSAASIAVKSENASSSYTYSVEEETAFDVEKLFSGLNTVSTETGAKDTFVITNNTDDKNKVEVVLRLQLESTSDKWTYSPLDYYSFVISDENGNEIYNSLNAKLSAATDKNKDIVLGTFNEQNETDTKTYTIEYKLSKEGANTLTADDISGLSFTIAANKVDEQPDMTAEPTPQPKFELPVNDEPKDEQPAVTETAAPEKSEKDNVVETVKEKKFVCGKDITPGRYVVKGNGVVKVESKLGENENEVVLNDGTVPNVEGKASAVITLSEGDVVTLLPLEGQEKASVSVEKTNSGSGQNSVSVRENATAAPIKTNPKTGENSTAIFAAVMIAAVAGIAVIEIVKRKKAE